MKDEEEGEDEAPNPVEGEGDPKAIDGKGAGVGEARDAGVEGGEEEEEDEEGANDGFAARVCDCLTNNC
jgi:hypothetical protein